MKTNDLSTRRALFWDIREEDIKTALLESDEWVIPRVFQYGKLEDIAAVIELYGIERNREVLRNAALGPVAEAMAYLFLNINPNNKYAA